jgi:hypothetical protein
MWRTVECILETLLYLSLLIFYNYYKDIACVTFTFMLEVILSVAKLANMLLVTSAADIKDLCSLFEIHIFSSIFIDRGSAVLTRGRVTVYWSALNK